MIQLNPKEIENLILSDIRYFNSLPEDHPNKVVWRKVNGLSKGAKKCLVDKVTGKKYM